MEDGGREVIRGMFGACIDGDGKEYTLAGNYNLEVYLDDKHGEIWVPVKKK